MPRPIDRTWENRYLHALDTAPRPWLGEAAAAAGVSLRTVQLRRRRFPNFAAREAHVLAEWEKREGKSRADILSP